jgi:predicted ribosomally synthesized peptide with SipW-like signal peptide
MKKKLLAICLVTIIAITAIAGASLAYLTDTHEQVNTFTSGNVDIRLDETSVILNADGYICAEGERRTESNQDYGKMFPGQVITKDPTITNTGSEKAYVAAKVTVTATDLESLIGTGYEGLLGINQIISGGLVKANDTMKQDHPLFGTLPVYGDETYSIYQEKVGENTHVFYIFIETIVAPQESVVLFEKLSIPAEWKNEQMAKIADLEITVNAYAVQVQTFVDCFDAMTTAFRNDFNF